MVAPVTATAVVAARGRGRQRCATSATHWAGASTRGVGSAMAAVWGLGACCCHAARSRCCGVPSVVSWRAQALRHCLPISKGCRALAPVHVALAAARVTPRVDKGGARAVAAHSRSCTLGCLLAGLWRATSSPTPPRTSTCTFTRTRASTRATACACTRAGAALRVYRHGVAQARQGTAGPWGGCVGRWLRT